MKKKVVRTERPMSRCFRFIFEDESYVNLVYELNGVEQFWHNEYGQKHRENGPAVIYPSGRKYWWLNDVFYFSEQEWKEELKRRELNE